MMIVMTVECLRWALVTFKGIRYPIVWIAKNSADPVRLGMDEDSLKRNFCVDLFEYTSNGSCFVLWGFELFPCISRYTLVLD